MAAVSPTITQADRDVAAEYVGANFGVKYVQATKAGGAWTGLAEAFARHREQAVAEKDAENARLREALIVLRDLRIVENDNPDTLWIDGEPHRGPAVDFLFKMVRSIKEVARKALEGRNATFFEGRCE